MTYPVSANLTRRAWGGIIAAANEAGVTPNELARQILQEAGLNYANMPKYKIGVLTAAELIDRFAPQELAAIKQIATQNAQVDALKNRLVSREQPVELDDPALLDGLNQLSAVGLLGPGRPAQLMAFEIPQPQPSTP